MLYQKRFLRVLVLLSDTVYLPRTLLNIYHGLVQSHFDYYSVVWGRYGCGNLKYILSNKLQKLQNRAA